MKARLLCQRLTDAYPRREVKGSIDQCSQCGERVHVADTSRDAIKRYADAEIWCLECCARTAPPDMVQWEVTDAQIDEIAHVTGRPRDDVARELIAIFTGLRRQREGNP